MMTVHEIERLADERRRQILSAKDELVIAGTRYYLSNAGDDDADGLAPEKAWKTLARASEADLKPGDAVLMKRGDLFRGQLRTKPGVSYAAYGEGDKPRLYGSERDLADPGLWELYDAEHSIWKCRVLLLDSGTLVFNHGEAHSHKLIPSYIGGKFVCRDDEGRNFCVAEEMTRDLDLFCKFDAKLTAQPSRGQDFPIPDVMGDCRGEVYLRCDRGNPGEMFDSIEALPRLKLIVVGDNENVRIDNLCLKYTGDHAVAAGGQCVKGLHVSNCEIGWIGGSIQHYLGTDPNYPQGGRGTVTRYGNGVEIYGGCDGYEVNDCWIYQVYDAGMTHQITCHDKPYHMDNVRYHHNLVEYCVYSIEYFLETRPEDTDSRMKGFEIDHNILRLSGYGWGQQRHNADTPAHIKGWSYVNTASEYTVHDNIFDRAGYRMLHLVAYEETSLPEMTNNTYIQYAGNMLGQYGANRAEEPPILPFDGQAEETIRNTLGETGAKVCRA